MKKKNKTILAIKKEVEDLLEFCDVNEFPTPVNELVSSSKLKCSSYDLEEKGFLKKIGNKFKKVFGKIKAFLNPKEKQILIDRTIHYAKEPFAKLHELGHYRIEWHREILFVCSEHDLDFRTRMAMEKEANIFAAEALFQGNKFRKISEQFPIDMKTILLLKDLCGSSFESTARRYVETNRNSCALAVLRPIPSVEEFGEMSLKLIYSIYSKSFIKEFGRVRFKDKFSSDHEISRIVNETSLEDILESKGKINDSVVKVQTFFNGFRVLALFING